MEECPESVTVRDNFSLTRTLQRQEGTFSQKAAYILKRVFCKYLSAGHISKRTGFGMPDAI